MTLFSPSKDFTSCGKMIWTEKITYQGVMYDTSWIRPVWNAPIIYGWCSMYGWVLKIFIMVPFSDQIIIRHNYAYGTFFPYTKKYDTTLRAILATSRKPIYFSWTLPSSDLSSITTLATSQRDFNVDFLSKNTPRRRNRLDSACKLFKNNAINSF